jgi:glutamate synthase domain-containing protein 3
MSDLLTMAAIGAVQKETAVVDARGVYYRELNEQLRILVERGARHIVLQNVAGHRYIGTNLRAEVQIEISGVPGNDLGAFMDGPQITVLGDAQDGCGNTMNSGSLVIHGSAGDILGHSMRGGSIYVRGNVGYRVGIHMKEFGETRPVIVIGGTAQHFLGEYMAGGVLIVLGSQLEPGQMHTARYIGTGMHGGVMYIRGRVDQRFLGKEVGVEPLSAEDTETLERHVHAFAERMHLEAAPLLEGEFMKLYPHTKRPYGRLYAY